MGMYPRCVRADVICSQTQRSVDRQFIFKPDPVTRNIIGASAARAQKLFPVKIYWLEYNINHEQAGLAPIDSTQENLTNLVKFKQLFHRLAAQEINRYLEREGPIFSGPSRDVHCVDEKSAHNQLEYALTNPVKDGLIDKIKHWDGFSSYQALALGRDPVYTYIDRTAWHKKGGLNSGKQPEAFTKSIRLEYTPLPGTEYLRPSQRQTLLRRTVRELEQSFREERTQMGLTAMTTTRMAKVNHRDRPTTRPPKTKKTLCHASNPDSRELYEIEHRIFLDAYRKASALYRSGIYDMVFPQGSFRPPLIVAAA